MAATGYALFPTPLGTCAIAWSALGVTDFWLPESDAAGTRARVVERLSATPESAPPPEVVTAIEAVCALLRGERTDLSFVALDQSASSAFNRRVYAVTCGIGPGQTLTYGEVAQRLGHPGLARAVGQALGANPIPVIVPCHRVMAAGQRPGGFSAPGGSLTKLRLLAIEGATPGGQGALFGV